MWLNLCCDLSTVRWQPCGRTDLLQILWMLWIKEWTSTTMKNNIEHTRNFCLHNTGLKMWWLCGNMNVKSWAIHCQDFCESTIQSAPCLATTCVMRPATPISFFGPSSWQRSQWTRLLQEVAHGEHLIRPQLPTWSNNSTHNFQLRLLQHLEGPGWHTIPHCVVVFEMLSNEGNVELTSNCWR